MQLRLSRVPMVRCVASCPQCKLPSDEYLVAESGMGGDFQTFRHVGSGALYRHDLTLAQYNPKADAEALGQLRSTRAVPINCRSTGATSL